MFHSAGLDKWFFASILLDQKQMLGDRVCGQWIRESAHKMAILEMFNNGRVSGLKMG